VQSLPIGSTVYRENVIVVTDTDAGPAGDITVSCQNPPGTNDVRIEPWFSLALDVLALISFIHHSMAALQT